MSNWKKELYFAVWKNDISKFDSILSLDEVKSELPNVKQWKWNEDPVHQAAFKGRDSMLKKLLENGANPNAYSVHDSGDKILPIHLAVCHNQMSSVEILIEFGADQTIKGEGYCKFHSFYSFVIGIFNINLCNVFYDLCVAIFKIVKNQGI